MLELGVVRPGSTIRIPFNTFDKDDGSAITMTAFIAADILVYKDGSTTERASTAGYTATTDFDAKTGKHLAIIDLADNTTAGFFSAGSEYLVAIDQVTVDGVTVGGWVARFTIGYPGAWLNTTIATLSTQTSFTLTAGPAEDDALNGWVVAIHDVASAVQMGIGVISDYVGSTKTVTLLAGVTFTAAATDNISLFPPVNANYAGAIAYSATRGLAGTALPAVAAEAAGGLYTRGSGAGQINQDANGRVDTRWVSGNVTVGTNSDKTGYTLSSAGVQAIWDALTSALTTANSVGKLLVDNVNATISSRAAGSLFTGITSVAEWLGLLAGKQTGNATARTEVRATGAGGGTYDETTDSLEALRDNIGAAGAGLTAIDLPDQTMNITGNLSGSVGSVTGAVGSVTGNVAGNVTGSVGSLATQAKADVNAEVLDVLNTDTFGEPGQEAPGATISLARKIGYLYKAWRNKSTQTASTYSLFADDTTTVDQKATVSDDGTTTTVGEKATGP